MTRFSLEWWELNSPPSNSVSLVILRADLFQVFCIAMNMTISFRALQGQPQAIDHQLSRHGSEGRTLNENFSRPSEKPGNG